MPNESIIGLIKYRFRLLLGHFKLHESLFEVTFTVASLFVNYKIRRDDIPLISEENIFDRL